jgi:hypothetical protein
MAAIKLSTLPDFEYGSNKIISTTCLTLRLYRNKIWSTTKLKQNKNNNKNNDKNNNQ